LLLFSFFILFSCIQCNNFPYCDPYDTLFTINQSAPPNVGKLRLIQVIVRHGARTPVVGECPLSNARWQCDFTSSEKPNLAPGGSLYSKNWIGGRNFYPGTCGMGVLTKLGYDQQIKNGMFFRQNYVNSTFLPDRINKDNFDIKFYIRSTDVPRVLLSAESILTGMYPPEKRDGNFSIKLNTMDQYLENLVSNAHVCPKVAVYESQFRSSNFYVNHTNAVTNPLIKKVALALNLKPENINLPSLFDCWISDYCHGFPLPSGVTEDLLLQVMREGEWQYGQSYQYPSRIEMSKPGIGTFMKEYLSIFQAAKSDSLYPRQFVMYTAHDTTIMPVLVALNAWNNIWPTFAAHIISEYYDAPSFTGSPAVRLLYNGKPLVLPGCGQEYCPFATFEKIVNAIIPTTAECKSTTTSHPEYMGYNINSFN